VLVLDDLHWADKPTLLLLKHLVSQGQGVRALIIATYRESDLGRGQTPPGRDLSTRSTARADAAPLATNRPRSETGQRAGIS
jgi:hypothetical protein